MLVGVLVGEAGGVCAAVSEMANSGVSVRQTIVSKATGMERERVRERRCLAARPSPRADRFAITPACVRFRITHSPQLDGVPLQWTNRRFIPDRVYVTRRNPDSQEWSFVPCGHSQAERRNAQLAGSTQGIRPMVDDAPSIEQGAATLSESGATGDLSAETQWNRHSSCSPLERRSSGSERSRSILFAAHEKILQAVAVCVFDMPCGGIGARAASRGRSTMTDRISRLLLILALVIVARLHVGDVGIGPTGPLKSMDGDRVCKTYPNEDGSVRISCRSRL